MGEVPILVPFSASAAVGVVISRTVIPTANRVYAAYKSGYAQTNHNITPENDYLGLAKLVLKNNKKANESIANQSNNLSGSAIEGMTNGEGSLNRVDNEFKDNGSIDWKATAGSVDTTARMDQVLERDDNGDPTRVSVTVTVSDTYDFNPKPWGERSVPRELSTRMAGPGSEFEWTVTYQVTYVKDANGNWIEE